MDPQESDTSRTSDTMNTPKFLAPQGSKLEQKSNARSRVKLAVFFVLSIHVVGLMALLLQGCKPEQPPEPVQAEPFVMPEFDPVMVAPIVDTNDVLQDPVVDLPPEDTGEPIVEPLANPQRGTNAVPVENAYTAPSEPSKQKYTIRRGDNYYTIGKSFGVSMQAIAAANPGVEPTRLQIGQVINLPSAEPAVANTAVPTTAEGTTHVVKSGDTLTKIASDYGTSVRAIRNANSLQTTVIRVGQKLTIPQSAPATGN